MQPSNPRPPCRPKPSFRSRVWYTACHDPWTFLYFFVYPFAFVWVTIGVTDIHKVDGCRVVRSMLWVVSGLMFFYLIGTFAVASVSCCWEASRVRKAHNKDRHAQQQLPASQMATHMFAPHFGSAPGAAR